MRVEKKTIYYCDRCKKVIENYDSESEPSINKPDLVIDTCVCGAKLLANGKCPKWGKFSGDL